jgi:predicted house-cleaning noncanonical NTP pyrophosphatase (MazG superfamily)
MVNDHPLVQYGLALIDEPGRLYLSHIEDQVNFDRVMDAISKIPTIETDDARHKLSQQLLKEPAEYIQSVKFELDKLNRSVEVIPIVAFGHQMKDYLKHIDEKKVDLLVLNTKDGDQLAMHGLAYPLAVEVRQIPLLML